MRSVLVVGGGVAGIAAATILADAGLSVSLIEKRPLLGGRASSYLDPATGDPVDVCQHGTMRCCTQLSALLDRLGVADRIVYHDTIHFVDGRGVRSVIRGSSLPAPAHTLPSFARFRALTVRDRLSAAWALMAVLRARPTPDLEARDVGSWLRTRGVTDGAMRRFFAPILVSACNEQVERISCTHAFKVLRDGFLANARGYHFGIPRVPLGTLFTEPTRAYLERRGGRVRLRTIAQAACVEANAVDGIALVGGEMLRADHYVAALPFDLLLRLLPEGSWRGVPYFEALTRLEFSPIIGVHLWLDRPVDCPNALAVLDRHIDWIFNKNANYGLPPGRPAFLSVVISANRGLTEAPAEEILRIAMEDVRDCLPEARKAGLVRSRVLKERKATFAPVPGAEGLRPVQQSPIANLAVAGEWTRTGWPSTMEGAARSGVLAANTILRRERMAERPAEPELPADGIARWLMR